MANLKKHLGKSGMAFCGDESKNVMGYLWGTDCLPCTKIWKDIYTLQNQDEPDFKEGVKNIENHIDKLKSSNFDYNMKNLLS